MASSRIATLFSRSAETGGAAIDRLSVPGDQDHGPDQPLVSQGGINRSIERLPARPATARACGIFREDIMGQNLL